VRFCSQGVRPGKQKERENRSFVKRESVDAKNLKEIPCGDRGAARKERKKSVDLPRVHVKGSKKHMGGQRHTAFSKPWTIWDTCCLPKGGRKLMRRREVPMKKEKWREENRGRTNKVGKKVEKNPYLETRFRGGGGKRSTPFSFTFRKK